MLGGNGDADRRRASRRSSRPRPRGSDVLHAADDLRPHPRLPLDGDAAPLDAPAGHVRRARARAQRLRGARRAGRGTRADPRDPHRLPATSGRSSRDIEDDAERVRASRLTFSSCTSPTSSRSPAAWESRPSRTGASRPRSAPFTDRETGRPHRRRAGRRARRPRRRVAHGRDRRDRLPEGAQAQVP